MSPHERRGAFKQRKSFGAGRGAGPGLEAARSGGRASQVPQQAARDPGALPQGEGAARPGQDQVPGAAGADHGAVRGHHPEPHGAERCPVLLLPGGRQPEPDQRLPHHGRGVRPEPGPRRLPLHDLRLAGSLWRSGTAARAPESSWSHIDTSRILLGAVPGWSDSGAGCPCGRFLDVPTGRGSDLPLLIAQIHCCTPPRGWDGVLHRGSTAPSFPLHMRAHSCPGGGWRGTAQGQNGDAVGAVGREGTSSTTHGISGARGVLAPLAPGCCW